VIAAMERLEIVCLRVLLDGVIPFLQEQGLLHLEEVPLALENAPGFLHRLHLSSEKQAEYDALEALNRTFAETAPLLSSAPSSADILDKVQELGGRSREDHMERARTWSRELRETTRHKANLLDSIDVLLNYRQVLLNVAPLMAERNAVLGKSARAIVLRGDDVRVLEGLEERLQEAVGPECSLYTRRAKRRTLVGVITYPEGKHEAVGEVLSRVGIVPVDAPSKDLHGDSVADVVARVDETVAKHRDEAAKLEDELSRRSLAYGAELLASQRILADELAQLKVVNNFAHSEMVGVVHGWIPRDAVARFKAELEHEFPGQVLVERLPMEDVAPTRVPTLLQNHKLFKPFELLLSILDPPTYGSLDPTPLVAVSFTLFYGFILGDWGYGLVICAVAYWVSRKWGRNELVRSAAFIAGAMGVSSIVFGLIYGEFFGDFLEKTFHFPYLFHRAHHTDQLLLIAILFGVIHIPLALILGIRESFKHKQYAHGYEKLGMLLGLMAVIIGVCGYYKVPVLSHPFMTYVAVALFVASVAFIFRGMGAMGIIGVLEIGSLGGNVLSYARLMALGVATVALADVANTTARDMGPLLGIPVALVVHALNIGVGVFSPTIHSVRLNYVEFLPKFFEPEGRLFKPFRKEALW
jgi:V/A-type H+/Na+-transporting ATPase subunit I